MAAMIDMTGQKSREIHIGSIALPSGQVIRGAHGDRLQVTIVILPRRLVSNTSSLMPRSRRPSLRPLRNDFPHMISWDISNFDDPILIPFRGGSDEVVMILQFGGL